MIEVAQALLSRAIGLIEMLMALQAQVRFANLVAIIVIINPYSLCPRHVDTMVFGVARRTAGYENRFALNPLATSKTKCASRR